MLKPVDIVVCAYFAAEQPEQWKQSEIAWELGISQSKVNQALKQLEQSGLWRQRQPVLSALEELLVHGVRFVYPAELRASARGVPTAYTKPVEGEHSHYVWPHEEGLHQGTTLVPLHRSVPGVALQHRRFHELLAAVDLMRVGRAREHKVASRQIHELLEKKG